MIEVDLPGPDPDLAARAALWPGVFKVVSEEAVAPLAARALDTIVVTPLRATSPTVTVGPENFVVVAGPCAVEDPETLATCAAAVRAAGVLLFRAGAYKPRTSPYSFQGLGREGLVTLAHVAYDQGLAIVTEVLDPRDVDFVASHAEILQLGARSMQNYPLLREAGASKRPILLKRGPAATLEEWIGAAEYCLEAGAASVILCERGVRGFDPDRRNVLDLSVVPALKARCKMPVFVDPSHATGRRALVPPMAKAAVVAGADGVMVEVHPEPQHSRSDAAQAMSFGDFVPLLRDLEALARFENRTFVRASPSVSRHDGNESAPPRPQGERSPRASRGTPSR